MNDPETKDQSSEPKAETSAEIKPDNAKDNTAPLDPAAVLTKAQHTILKSFPDIVDGLIASAKKGGHLPAKFLMEIGGIKLRSPEEILDEKEESFAEMLFKELEEAKAE